MTTQPNLLILGGGALNTQAILEAKNHGFKTFVADGNENAPCFAIADVPVHADIRSAEALLPHVRNWKIDGVVTMAEVGVIAAAEINQMLGRNVVSLQSAIWATSKASMRTRWEGSPFNVDFRIVSSLSEAVNATTELGQWPLIVKPDKTYGGSRGVSKIHGADQLEEAFRFAVENGMNDLVVIEACAEGEEFSCEVLVVRGVAHVLAVGQKVKSPLPYRVDCSVQYQGTLDKVEQQQVSRMAQDAVARLLVENGVAHIEFAATSRGLKLFELGVRCGGGHTPMIAKHVSGTNEFIEYCKLSCGIQNPLVSDLPKKGADYRFVIFPPGKVDRVAIDPKIHGMHGVYDVVVTAKEGDTIRNLRTTSDRSGAIVTFGVDKADAVDIANRASKLITVFYTDGSCSHPIVPDQPVL